MALATGAGNGGGSGLGRSRETGGWLGEEFDFEKASPPPPFIKVLGSRRVHFAIIANLSQTCFTCKSNFQY